MKEETPLLLRCSEWISDSLSFEERKTLHKKRRRRGNQMTMIKELLHFHSCILKTLPLPRPTVSSFFLINNSSPSFFSFSFSLLVNSTSVEEKQISMKEMTHQRLSQGRQVNWRESDLVSGIRRTGFDFVAVDVSLSMSCFDDLLWYLALIVQIPWESSLCVRRWQDSKEDLIAD